MSKQRKHPFTAYVLMPAMQVKQVELVAQDGMFTRWHTTSNHRSFHDDQLYETHQAAIAAGRAKLDEQRAKLAKQQANIEKRTANLDKAAAKL